MLKPASVQAGPYFMKEPFSICIGKRVGFFFTKWNGTILAGFAFLWKKKSCSVAESNGTLLSTGNIENCDRVSHQEHGASVLKQMVR